MNRITAWRFVVTFGLVSLLGDVVYQGMRSISGPLLRDLGAAAVTVGIVTGLGEAAALLFRLASGPLADRSGNYWRWALLGYGITAVSVPLLGWSGAVWVAASLIVVERFGKAVRSPSKDALLAHATAATGRGKGFAVHKALDQFGAVLGPLAVAGAMALFAGRYGPSLSLLAIPGAASLAVLAYLRRLAPRPADYELAADLPGASQPAHQSGHPARQSQDPSQQVAEAPGSSKINLPSQFWLYAVFAGINMTGFATFGLIAFHLVDRGLLPEGLVPLLYAGAMAVDALMA
ncbi:MAG: MFS transporter, partial [Micrococcales bacterium]|nr:MFS transporter [Micrococcales bacterium]